MPERGGRRALADGCRRSRPNFSKRSGSQLNARSPAPSISCPTPTARTPILSPSCICVIAVGAEIDDHVLDAAVLPGHDAALTLRPPLRTVAVLPTHAKVQNAALTFVVGWRTLTAGST